MKKISDVKENIKEGSILTLSNISGYCACLIRYDGEVLKDVSEVEFGNLLEELPNIKNVIENEKYLKVRYNFEQRKYESAIMNKVRNGGYKEVYQEELISDFLVNNESFEASLIDLDTKLSIEKKIPKVKQIS
jgi:hypothetical protein